MSVSRLALLAFASFGLTLAACGQKAAETDAVKAPDGPASSPAPGPASAAPATPADVTVGTAPPLPTGRPALDPLGVSLGQPLDQARAAFKAAAGSGLTSYKEPIFGLPGGGRFISGMFAHNQPKAGMVHESLGALLTGPPLTPQVWYVGRSLMYPRGAEPAAPAVLKALTDKYGPPQRTQAPSTYFWTWDAAGVPTGAPLACGVHSQLGSQVAGTANSPAAAPHGEPPPSACARIIQVQINGLNDLVSEMHIGLTDNDLMSRARAQTIAAAEAQAAKARQDALKNAGATPKL